jgi:hypothetical protein
MKKLTKLLIVLIALQFACSKDDEVVITTGGTFTLDGTSYVLSKGFLVDEGGEYGIILTSSGISLESSTGDDFIGTGNFVSLYIISSSSTSFDPGTFTWSDNKSPGTIEDVGVGVNFNLATDTGDVELDGTGGTVSVALSGDIYTITFSITTDGSVVTGSYIGTLTDVQD